jgi:glycyl-tRNA synthetase (class II)
LTELLPAATKGHHFQFLEDKQVTIRDRDSLAQIRVPIEQLEKILKTKLKGETFDASTLRATRQK